MAKVSLARKKELNEPDKFIDTSNQIADVIRDNMEKVIGAIASVIIIVLSIAGYQLYTANVSEKAFSAFAEDIAWYEEAEKDSKSKSLQEIKDRSDVFFKNYSGTPAGTLARAKYAGIFYAEGEYKSAVTLYQRLVKDLNKNDPLKNMFLSGLAHSYEAQDDYVKAIETFNIISEGKSSVKKDEALFHLGMLYELTGDKVKSKEAFEKIASFHLDSIYIDIAKEKI